MKWTTIVGCVRRVGWFREGWMPLPGCGGGQMGKKKGNGVGVEKGVTKGDTDDGCRYVGKGWTVHGGGCANIDSF